MKENKESTEKENLNERIEDIKNTVSGKAEEFAKDAKGKAENFAGKTLDAAEKLINDKWKAYGEAFSVRDPQDLLAMCALQLATETLKLKNKAEESSSAVNDEINSILKMMEHVV